MLLTIWSHTLPLAASQMTISLGAVSLAGYGPSLAFNSVLLQIKDITTKSAKKVMFSCLSDNNFLDYIIFFLILVK